MSVRISDLGTAYKIRYDRLRHAVFTGDARSVEELLPTRADILKDFGEGLLRKACMEGYPDVVRVLLAHGAKPPMGGNQRPDNLLKTVIWSIRGNSSDAERNSCIKILHLLIEHGVNPNMMDGDLQVPLHYSCDLEEKDTDAALELTRTLLDAGADVNARNHHNETPLLKVTNNGNVAVAELLIDRGADVNAKDEEDCAPLSDASRGGYADLVRLLLSHGADVNILDKHGYTPLHWACEEGHADIARLLLEVGADVNIKNGIGSTPLHRACAEGHADTAHLLLDAGADVNTRDVLDETALDKILRWQAGLSSREEIIDLFRQYAPELVFEQFCTRGPRV